MKHGLGLLFIIAILLFSSCFTPQTWPESPLYTFDTAETSDDTTYPKTIEDAMQAIEGRYAHYDVVAYEDNSTETPIKTFVISYAFTDFFVQEGKLYQKDTFLYSNNKINQPMVETYFSDKAAQAIVPKVQEVELQLIAGVWHIYRPPTPTLLGIQGDPLKPLARIKNDPNIIDADNDGKPGVTVNFKIAGIWDEEMYITRREIFSNRLKLLPDGTLAGNVIDESEQFIIDATMNELKQSSNAVQNPDPGMNPLLLVPIDNTIDNSASNTITTIEDFKQNRDRLFPPEPEFE